MKARTPNPGIPARHIVTTNPVDSAISKSGDRGAYLVFAVPKAWYANGALADLDQPHPLRELHQRVDDLSDDDLFRCADSAWLSRAFPEEHEDELDWARRLLHAAIDQILAEHNRFVEHLQLDGVALVCSGEFEREMGAVFQAGGNDSYAMLAALSASGVTDEPLPYPENGTAAAPSRVSAILPLRDWMAAHLKQAMDEASVAATSPVRQRVVDRFWADDQATTRRTRRTRDDLAAAIERAEGRYAA